MARRPETKHVLSLRQLATDATNADRAADVARKRAQQLFNTDALASLRHPEDHGLAVDPKDLVTALDHWRTGLTSSATWAPSPPTSNPSPLPSSPQSQPSAPPPPPSSHDERIAGSPSPRSSPPGSPRPRKAQKGNAAVKPLKTAEAWLKEQASDIRNERFAPIKEKAQAIWNQLRMQSNVALEDIRLTGSAARRSVDLDVTVDGTKGPALGVMSQGELNALALSLFIPRATLAESPFRFVVIDDPVQSMDPSRIDGLARALHETASQRQVVVFTHDDRLPEAVRRLAIPATVIEVMRREGSAVELRTAKDPVSRYIEDAMALALTDGLPARSRPTRRPRPLPRSPGSRLHGVRATPPPRQRRVPRGRRGPPRSRPTSSTTSPPSPSSTIPPGPATSSPGSIRREARPQPIPSRRATKAPTAATPASSSTSSTPPRNSPTGSSHADGTPSS